MNKRHIDPRGQFDALTNRSLFCLWLLCFVVIIMFWMQFLIDYDVEPDAVSLETRILSNYSYSTPGYFESWPWSTCNFSAFDEYKQFIGGSEDGNNTYNVPFETHLFSVDRSDRIEIYRNVPDTRHILCSIRNKKFHEQMRFVGKTSVIITFYNEAASVLLRTITSILRNTPSHLLGEIVLIDDCSTIRLNATFLQHFHPKIHFRRNAQRQGVIASRNIGAMLMAGFEYIFFMDSHCEVNVGWLEPLVERMLRNPGMVVSPTLDVIDAYSFEYGIQGGTSGMRAGFDWSLKSRWFSVDSDGELEDLVSVWDEPRSYASPTTAGGLLGMTRQWFVELGGFNKNLQMWGGESLELSLRVWMCGGHVEMVPCSRVGHIFRSKLPYELPLGERATHSINSRTIAERWFGDYKRLFYEHSLDVDYLPTKRVQFKQIQNCQSFRWYLENVYQELIPLSNKYLSMGQLQQAGRCMEQGKTNQTDAQLLPCQLQSADWLLLQNGQLALENQPGYCLWADGNVVKIYNNCDDPSSNEDLLWMRITNTLVHQKSGGCLDVMNDNTDQKPWLVIQECKVRERPTQIWHFTVNI